MGNGHTPPVPNEGVYVTADDWPGCDCPYCSGLQFVSDVPPALVKAMHDTFQYSMGLRDGSVIDFTDAEAVSPEWVHISNITRHPFGPGAGIRFNFERGMDIRISEIAWVADAPFGS